jgi:methionyl-tRNA formyltransferase
VSRPRIVFFGTPAFAVPSLEAVHRLGDVVAVVCQPDKPVGRGMQLTAPPVKQRALELGLDVHQPTKLKTPEFAAWVHGLAADVAVVVAYGRILPKAVLEGPRLGCVNVHGSLLPRWRGAAPIQWAVIAGDRETGIALMKLDEGLDTGPVFAFCTTPIAEGETSGALFERLAPLGAALLERELPAYLAGTATLVAQDEHLATHARMLEKSDGVLDFSAGAASLASRVAGVSPWPGATTTLKGKVVKVHAARAHEARTSAAPGTVIRADKGIVLVATGEGALELVTVQLEGKKPMKATDWVLGRGLVEGDVLGSA